MKQTGITPRMEARYKLYEAFGQKHTNAEWIKIMGLPRNTVWRYFKRGLSIEEICKLRNIQIKN